MLKYFQIIFLKTPPKGGWLGDHALYTLIEYLLNLCMNRVVGMSYTLDSHYISIGITIDFFYVCILICVFHICMLQTSNSINFDWYLLFHTYIYIYDLIVLTISLHLKAQIMFMLSLIYSLMNIIFQIGILYKLMHHSH